DLSKAPRVDDSQLAKMNISQPLARKKKEYKQEHPQSKKNKTERKEDGAKELKSLYQSTFRTITETAGSVQECLRRSTLLSKNEIVIVAGLDNVVHALNSMWILADKALRLYLFKTLNSNHNHAMASPAEERESVDPNPLDLLLTRKYGRSIIRNLTTILMSGKTTDTRKPTDPKGWVARSVAEEIVGGLKSVVGAVKPLKGHMKVALTVVQKSMARI
ncbi:hypothetical protein BGZ65_008642, partial [Modicella reniformis]